LVIKKIVIHNKYKGKNNQHLIIPAPVVIEDVFAISPFVQEVWTPKEVAVSVV
jgi:hypothetical protein